MVLGINKRLIYKQKKENFRRADSALQLFWSTLTRSLIVAVLVLPLALRADEPVFLSTSIGGIPYYAGLHENRELLALLDTNTNTSNAKHFRGELLGYPVSAVRVTWARGVWRGIVLLSGKTYRINQFDESAVNKNITTSVFAYAVVGDADHDAFCATEGLEQSSSLTSTSPSLSGAVSAATAIFPVAATTACDNAINDICLLPHIEFAYDQSYQSLPDLGLTPLERAIQDINEMEVFFELDFGYRFGQLTLTMLSTAEEADISTTKNPYTLINDLWVNRNAGRFDGFLQSRRSIFHFVTGRNFDPVNGANQIDLTNGTNVIGIAYPGTVCFDNGQSLGITDAGDASVGDVSSLSQSLVSRVIAHEIGHNLGAGDHDGQGENTCSSGINLMSASINSNLNGFSSCSIVDIKSLVGSPSSQCFDFPIDLAIRANCENVSEPHKVTAFQSSFTVTRVRRDSSGVSTQIGIYGEIPDSSHGRFVSVRAAGNDCVVIANGLSYQCSLLNPPANIELDVSVSIDENTSEFSASHQVYSEASALIDVDGANNTVEQFYNTFTAQGSFLPVSVCPGSASQGGNSESNSTGGGGGSIDVWALLLLVTHSLFRYRQRNNG